MNRKLIKQAAPSRWTLVYHLSHPLPNYLKPPDVWPDNYQLVAAVNTNELETAFLLTNHIDQAWQENDGVFTFVGSCRSTSVNDVVVTPDGKAHVCLEQGWKELVPQTAIVSPPRPRFAYSLGILPSFPSRLPGVWSLRRWWGVRCMSNGTVWQTCG
jgi:hypothetical protein